jgi:hypothetical protein
MSTLIDRRRVLEDTLAGYELLARRRVDAGWRAYLVTMTFRHLRGKPDAVLTQMLDEAERFYSRFVTRVVRRPRVEVASLPVLIVAPDRPVGKSGKRLRDVVVNDGLHLHGVLLVPPISRLRVAADEHVRSEQPFYVASRAGEPPRLVAIDVRPVDNDVDRVVSYGLKSVARRRFSPDDVLVLPKASSELS